MKLCHAAKTEYEIQKAPIATNRGCIVKVQGSKLVHKKKRRVKNSYIDTQTGMMLADRLVVNWLMHLGFAGLLLAVAREALTT
jgi:hypothetical protein